MFRFCFTIVVVLTSAVACEKVLYAVNFGGDTFEGSDGVVYKSNKIYGSNHFPRNLTNVPEHDLPLYQTGIDGNNQHFELPIAGNGVYVLTVKFPSQNNEVTMAATLNERYVILEKFNAVINATNDLSFDFEVYNNKMIWEEIYTDFQRNVVPIRFTGLHGNHAWIAAMKLTYTPIGKAEQLLQDMRDDLRKLVNLLEKKETKEL
jgi:Malectin domain